MKLGPARLCLLGDLELVLFFFLRFGLLARANLLAASCFLRFFLHGAIAGTGLVRVMNAHCDVSLVAGKPQPWGLRRSPCGDCGTALRAASLK